ncbi:MAG: YcnI family protein [Rhodococcus sp. (in: high G+C Gram-positive bacteria)]|uniref:YcnI family copper-binding membrane protein n=1 Tax=Rhodococcus sp. TaxID=1831 RepID=UPI003BB1801C
MNPRVSRALLTLGAAGSALLLTPGVAAAHVTVVAPGAEQGGYSVLTFRVPTESDTAATTKLTVQLPGLKSARTEALPGWTSVVEKDATSKLATSVTWTADAGVGIAPGQFQQFVLSAGPLPVDDEVSFPAAQTYSDGRVVDWNQEATPDAEKPEKPAPTLTLVTASGDDDSHTAGAGADETDATASGTDDTARWLGGIGLALGALGAALGLGALVRSKRP